MGLQGLRTDCWGNSRVTAVSNVHILGLSHLKGRLSVVVVSVVDCLMWWLIWYLTHRNLAFSLPLGSVFCFFKHSVQSQLSHILHVSRRIITFSWLIFWVPVSAPSPIPALLVCLYPFLINHAAPLRGIQDPSFCGLYPPFQPNCQTTSPFKIYVPEIMIDLKHTCIPPVHKLFPQQKSSSWALLLPSYHLVGNLLSILQNPTHDQGLLFYVGWYDFSDKVIFEPRSEKNEEASQACI